MTRRADLSMHVTFAADHFFHLTLSVQIGKSFRAILRLTAYEHMVLQTILAESHPIAIEKFLFIIIVRVRFIGIVCATTESHLVQNIRFVA